MKNGGRDGGRIREEGRRSSRKRGSSEPSSDSEWNTFAELQPILPPFFSFNASPGCDPLSVDPVAFILIFLK